MPQTSANVTAGNDAKSSEFNKVVADLSEIYSGGPGVPVGGVIYWWSDGTVPLNYKVCDGSAVSDVASALNGLTVPDLRNKFIRGVATANLRTTPVNGGADTVDLTHHHFTNHSHGIGADGAHSHNIQTNSGTYRPGQASTVATSGTGYGPPGHDHDGVAYGVGNHSHGGATGATNAQSDDQLAVVSLLPSYRGLVPIMRIK